MVAAPLADPPPTGRVTVSARAENPHPLQQFVRQVLGCACPDEVLRNISLEPPPPSLADLPVGRLLNVGGRLLVMISRPDFRPRDAAELVHLGKAALALRDAHGFNRVRIVLPAADGALACPPFPDELGERIHWHQVPYADLRRVLAAGGT